MKNKNLILVTFSFGMLLLSACTKKTPAWEYMPDMYESTSLKAQKEDPLSKDGAAARTPPEGTIPRGFEPYHYGVADTLLAGKELRNPLLHTKANVERGQKIFNTYCIVCHGPKGNGEGYIVPPYPRPPSLLSDKITKYADGSIFNVITKGQNNMPSYASQIKSEDRWAVILYVRALQRAANPPPEDQKEMADLKESKK
jgi:mono/diheme cytochrome c family protein